MKVDCFLFLHVKAVLKYRNNITKALKKVLKLFFYISQSHFYLSQPLCDVTG